MLEASPGSFIYEIHNALPGDVCQEMVRRFEERENEQRPGRIGQQASKQQDVKLTTDVPVSGKPGWQDIDKKLFTSLSKALQVVREEFPFFKGPFKDSGYHMQRYQPGEYYHWHIDGGSHEFSQRQLVALWYLNDVHGPGGETEFLYQQLKVKPEEGKLVLFPPFWTHEHRAVKLESGVKYIATTWVVFA